MHWRGCSFFFFQAEDGIRDLTVTGVQTCALPIYSARCSRRSSMKRAAAITEKVMRNNSAPSAISEELYRAPTASVNSLAMDAEMVVPGASTDAPMRCPLPMTKGTAMVSRSEEHTSELQS